MNWWQNLEFGPELVVSDTKYLGFPKSAKAFVVE
jgi:hypothetical protein